MCEIAPFFMECKWEDVQDKLVMCRANRLECAFRELAMSLPVVGALFTPYVCRGFEMPCDELRPPKGE